MRGEEMKWTEYNAKDALNRLDYAIQVAKDEGNKPEISIFARECGLGINKTIAKKYIKEAFTSMDSDCLRDVEYIVSAESTFEIHKTCYGTIWVNARLERTRTEENLAKHALMDVAREEIWNEEE